jgi:hypothetical protein
MIPGRVVVSRAHRPLYADTTSPATLIAFNTTLRPARALDSVVERGA